MTNSATLEIVSSIENELRDIKRTLSNVDLRADLDEAFRRIAATEKRLYINA